MTLGELEERSVTVGGALGDSLSGWVFFPWRASWTTRTQLTWSSLHQPATSNGRRPWKGDTPIALTKATSDSRWLEVKVCIASRRRFHRSRQGQNKEVFLREPVQCALCTDGKINCTALVSRADPPLGIGQGKDHLSIGYGTLTPWRNHYRRVTWQTFEIVHLSKKCACAWTLRLIVQNALVVGCVYQQKALGKMSRVTDYQRVTAQLADRTFCQNLPWTENNIIAFPFWICCQSLHFRCWACCQLGVRLSSE